MFNAIIVLVESITSIIRRVYVYTLNCACKVFFKCAESKKVVAVNKHIAGPQFPIGESASFDLPKTIFRGVKEQTRLYGKRLVLLANPRKFQFIYFVLCHLFVSLFDYFNKSFLFRANFFIRALI